MTGFADERTKGANEVADKIRKERKEVYIPKWIESEACMAVNLKFNFATS